MRDGAGIRSCGQKTTLRKEAIVIMGGQTGTYGLQVSATGLLAMGGQAVNFVLCEAKEVLISMK